jgi:hypothetical protein
VLYGIDRRAAGCGAHPSRLACRHAEERTGPATQSAPPLLVRRPPDQQDSDVERKLAKIANPRHRPRSATLQDLAIKLKALQQDEKDGMHASDGSGAREHYAMLAADLTAS